MTTPSTQETTTEWMYRQISQLRNYYPGVARLSSYEVLGLAQHLGGNWDMAQQARAARPPAILPDVRDVVTNYETIVARLKARVQALADLLQDEVNRDTAALDEMRRTLDEIREEPA